MRTKTVIGMIAIVGIFGILISSGNPPTSPMIPDVLSGYVEFTMPVEPIEDYNLSYCYVQLFDYAELDRAFHPLLYNETDNYILGLDTASLPDGEYFCYVTAVYVTLTDNWNSSQYIYWSSERPSEFITTLNWSKGVLVKNERVSNVSILFFAFIALISCFTVTRAVLLRRL